MAAKNTDLMTFSMSREFKKPRAAVWKAWSDAELLQKWWGPKGCTVRARSLEFKPGGFFHYAMVMEGQETWGRFNYREIVAQERIVWLNSFANENGGIARAPFSEYCPMEIQNTVVFAESGGVTNVHLRAAPFGETAAERQFFNELCEAGSLAMGYGGTFDQLGELLSAG